MKRRNNGPGRDREDVGDPGAVPSDVASDSGTSGGTDPRLIADLRVEPIRAWKQARLVRSKGEWRFAGVGLTSATYGVEGSAECRKGDGVWGFAKGGIFSTSASYTFTMPYSGTIRLGTDPAQPKEPEPKHEAPHAECTCGFHAVADKPGWTYGGGAIHAILEVELFGRVIEHEHGYRAEKQRVLCATTRLDAIAAHCTAKKCEGLSKPAWFRRVHDGAERCAKHVVKDRRHYEIIEPAEGMQALRRDLPTEWKFA